MAELDHHLLNGDGVRLRDAGDDLGNLATTWDDPAIRRLAETLTRGVPDKPVFVIAEPDTDRPLGAIGLIDLHAGGAVAEITGWVAPPDRRRGIGTAATRTFAQWAFARGIRRIELPTGRANEAGHRVALGAGFTHEGVRRGAGTGTGMVIWARLATDPGTRARRALPDLPDGYLSDGVVTLIPLRASDAGDMFALTTLPEVLATMVTPAPPTEASTAARCAEAGYLWLLGARAEFTIRDAATGAFAGEIGLYYEQLVSQAMIGYSMTRQWRGRGYPTAAARLLADWAFDVVGVARMVAGTAPGNIGSQRVLEGAGFTREGYERQRLPGPAGTRIDNIPYALLPGDRTGTRPA